MDVPIRDDPSGPAVGPAPGPDAASVGTSWRVDLATAVLTGLVTTYLPMQRWSRAARWSLHAGMGAAAGLGTALLLRDPERFVDPDEREDPPARLDPRAVAAVAVTVGAAVAGVSRGGEAADSWTERTLLARGVRRPRLWMGVGAAGASLAMSVADRKRTPPTG